MDMDGHIDCSRGMRGAADVVNGTIGVVGFLIISSLSRLMCVIHYLAFVERKT